MQHGDTLHPRGDANCIRCVEDGDVQVVQSGLFRHKFDPLFVAGCTLPRVPKSQSRESLLLPGSS